MEREKRNAITKGYERFSLVFNKTTCNIIMINIRILEQVKKKMTWVPDPYKDVEPDPNPYGDGSY